MARGFDDAQSSPRSRPDQPNRHNVRWPGQIRKLRQFDRAPEPAAAKTLLRAVRVSSPAALQSPGNSRSPLIVSTMPCLIDTSSFAGSMPGAKTRRSRWTRPVLPIPSPRETCLVPRGANARGKPSKETPATCRCRRSMAGRRPTWRLRRDRSSGVVLRPYRGEPDHASEFSRQGTIHPLTNKSNTQRVAHAICWSDNKIGRSGAERIWHVRFLHSCLTKNRRENGKDSRARDFVYKAARSTRF